MISARCSLISCFILKTLRSNHLIINTAAGSERPSVRFSDRTVIQCVRADRSCQNLEGFLGFWVTVEKRFSSTSGWLRIHRAHVARRRRRFSGTFDEAALVLMAQRASNMWPTCGLNSA